jgi:hypothetical protein
MTIEENAGILPGCIPSECLDEIAIGMFWVKTSWSVFLTKSGNINLHLPTLFAA